jgi:hypothetical protein
MQSSLPLQPLLRRFWIAKLFKEILGRKADHARSTPRRHLQHQRSRNIAGVRLDIPSYTGEWRV